MSEFKWRHFEGEIVLWAVRWYCRYGISYRDLEQMIARMQPHLGMAPAMPTFCNRALYRPFPDGTPM